MSETKSFWATLPGVLTALATVIVAITGLFTALSAVGFIGTKAPETSEARTISARSFQASTPGTASSYHRKKHVPTHRSESVGLDGLH
jgi:hypothetical protein